MCLGQNVCTAHVKATEALCGSDLPIHLHVALGIESGCQTWPVQHVPSALSHLAGPARRFLRQFHAVAQNGPELEAIPLPWPPKCYDYGGGAV